jgi:hypothetical protein
MKYFSVHMPVAASVSVIVKADDDVTAEEIASHVANLSDAECVDFVLDQPEIIEIERNEIPKGSRIWVSKNKYELK